MDDRLPSLLETTTPERLATGFVFTEGPLWHPDGFYTFVDIRRSKASSTASCPARPPSSCARTPARATAPRSTSRAGS
jgi:hypothetical protein